MLWLAGGVVFVGWGFAVVFVGFVVGFGVVFAGLGDVVGFGDAGADDGVAPG